MPSHIVLRTTTNIRAQRNLKPDSKASREVLVERVKANMKSVTKT